MPANSTMFPWPSYYGHYNFFEQRMATHSAVAAIRPLDDGLYEISLKAGQSLKVFVCECYSFGQAEYAESVQKLGRLDAIVINSNWCGYTHELKMQCRSECVGLFSVGDFMGALNKREYWLYLNKHDLQTFKEKGWL